MLALTLLLAATDPDVTAPSADEPQRGLNQFLKARQCANMLQRAEGGRPVTAQPAPYAVTPEGEVVPYDPNNPPLLQYAFALNVEGCPIPVVNPNSQRGREDFIRELGGAQPNP